MNDKVAILEDKGFGFFRVTHCGSVIADFLYCTGSGEQGYMTRDSAKKLATKIARYVVSRGTVCTIEEYHLTKSFSTLMTDTLNITIVDDPVTGFFWVLLENRCVATFYYCTEGEEGLFTKKQAKKLTEKLVRKIEKSTTIKTKKGFKLVKRERNNNDQR